MSQRLNLQTHKFEKDKNTGIPKLVEFNPYISIKAEIKDEKGVVVDGGELFIQNGTVFSLTGPPVSDPPKWFWDEVAKLTPKALAEVKFRHPEKARDENGGAEEIQPAPLKRRGRPKKRLNDG